MGPKAKGPIIIDGVNTTELTREQLEKFALTLKETLDREREERNFFQLERDKIRTFWEITKTQLDENRADLRNKDREMEEKEEDHEAQARLFKQKVKHLLYEHHGDIAELRAEGMLSLKMTQEDFSERELELLLDKKKLKEKILEQQKQHQEEVRELNVKFAEDLSNARTDYESEAREIEAKYEDRLQEQRTELSLRHSMEVTEVDERKNKQISELMKSHDKAFSEMKNYYNDITLNNLALISSLKEQMEEMKRREDRTEKALRECQKNNRNLENPMKEALAENQELKRQLSNYSRDKMSLANTKRMFDHVEKELESCRWENEVLELRLKRLEQERNELRLKFRDAILEIQQKSGLKTVLLEKKLKALVELFDQREVQFAQLLSAIGIDVKTKAIYDTKVEQLLKKKNAAIQDLEYELARVCKAHDDLLQTYEGKLIQYGIPKEELGFIPLRCGVKTGKGPAGLVTSNK